MTTTIIYSRHMRVNKDHAFISLTIRKQQFSIPEVKSIFYGAVVVYFTHLNVRFNFFISVAI